MTNKSNTGNSQHAIRKSFGFALTRRRGQMSPTTSTSKEGKNRVMRAARLLSLSALVLALLAVTSTPALAGPAPYWGGINVNVPHAWGGYGNDCTVATGFHNNQAQYPPNGRAQAAGTFICDGTRNHDLYVIVFLQVANPGDTAYTTVAQTVWQHTANAWYGMGKTTLYSPVFCNPGWVNKAGAYWYTLTEFWIDGNTRWVATPAQLWKPGPNLCR